MSPTARTAIVGLAQTDDEIIDTSIAALTLTAPKARGYNTDIAAAIIDGYVEQTITGAPQLILDIMDADYAALQSGVFEQRIDVDVDGVPFRLVQVSLTDVERLELTFEHRLVSALRSHVRPRKVSRWAMTRAQFVLSMLQEVKAEAWTYHSPDLAKVQPLKPGSPISATKTITSRSSGFAAGVSLNVKGQKATAAQLAQAATLLSVGTNDPISRLNPPRRVLEAIICAGIQETVLGADPGTFTPTTGDGAGTWGVLQVASGRGSLPGTGIDAHDTATMAHYFYLGGKGMEGGGAIAYSRANPTASPGDIARHVENPGSSSTPYQQWEAEARAIVAAFKGQRITFQSSTTTLAQYDFSRGTPGQPEDSWTCALRLASEVGWRCFVSGRRSLYFVDDEQLLRSKPVYEIDPWTVGIQRITFDTEVARRLIVIKGVRQPKPSQCLITARLDRWAAPPGAIIALNHTGPGDGKWIVNRVKRPLFDPEGEIELHTASPEKPEPAGTIPSTTKGAAAVTGSTVAAQIYAHALGIIAKGYPYVWGGGHARVGVPDGGERGGPGGGVGLTGYDCSGFVSACLHGAGVLGGALDSTALESWGSAGRGTYVTVWANASHVWFEFHFPGKPQQYAGTSNQGVNGGPALTAWPGDSYASQFTPRHVPGM